MALGKELLHGAGVMHVTNCQVVHIPLQALDLPQHQLLRWFLYLFICQPYFVLISVPLTWVLTWSTGSMSDFPELCLWP